MGFLLVTTPIALFYSCSESSDEVITGGDVSITGVYKYAYIRPSESEPIDYSAPLDSLTTTGYSGVTYLIRGTGLSTASKITVNGIEIDFNTTLASDSQIFIQLPTGIPYSNDNTPNTLIVETMFGKASTPFIIGQPFPTITRQPWALLVGETVTIEGEDFNNLEDVSFGTYESPLSGEIVSYDEETAMVIVPDGISSTGYIFITTPGGTTVAPVVYGADYPLFEEDELFNDWSWCVVHEPSDEQARDGMYSEKLVFAGWDALYMNVSNDPFNNPVDVSEYSYMKISLYSDVNTKVRIFMDWDADSKPDINIAEGVWTDYLIPMSDIASYSPSGDIVIQEFTGSASTVYVDNIGFIK